MRKLRTLVGRAPYISRLPPPILSLGEVLSPEPYVESLKDPDIKSFMLADKATKHRAKYTQLYPHGLHSLPGGAWPLRQRNRS